MLIAPERREIDHRTIKLIIGLIALFLANVTSWLSRGTIESISASYYAGGAARDVLVGSLFAITAFMLAYNGQSPREMVLSKVAAVAGMGVALFPCNCGGHPEAIPGVHATSAAVMFLVLAALCYTFHQRARAKGHAEALRRSYIYAVSGLAIVGSVVTVGGDHLLKGAISSVVPRLTFYCERTGLFAFGIAWLTASRVLPGLTRSDERFAPWSGRIVP